MNKKFSQEEKQQLLDNLEIESKFLSLLVCTHAIINTVAHRKRRLEDELSDALEKFIIRQEGQISRIPRLVRAMSLREFKGKYKGDIKAALRGLQMEKLGVTGGDETAFSEIDKSARKRKWVASVGVDGNAHTIDAGPGSTDDLSRASKTGKCNWPPVPRRSL
jgi:hypothetical protein